MTLLLVFALASLGGANEKAMEVEVLESNAPAGARSTPVNDAIVMVRPVRPLPAAAEFITLGRDRARAGYYKTQRIPAATTHLELLIQKPSRDPQFSDPVRDFPKDPVPYAPKITRTLRRNALVQWEGRPRQRFVLVCTPWGERLIPADCCDPCACCCIAASEPATPSTPDAPEAAPRAEAKIDLDEAWMYRIPARLRPGVDFPFEGFGHKQRPSLVAGQPR